MAVSCKDLRSAKMTYKTHKIPMPYLENPKLLT